MKSLCIPLASWILALSLALPSFAKAEISEKEADTIAFFEAAGARVTRNEEGHAVRLFSQGNPPHSTEDLQRIGSLPELEQLALNNPVAEDGEWEFLRKLPKLRQLTIWHCKTISSLAPFSGLSIESLTVGGSMGLRDRNREEPQRYRDVILTLTDLPNLRSANLYHSPLLPGDEHIAHLVEHFPRLEDLRIDVNAPRGSETTITPEGLRILGKLPLVVLSLENIDDFTVEHIEALATIDSLEALLIDCRKNPFDTAPLEAAMREARPEVQIVVAGEGAKGPPRRIRD